MQLGGLLAHLLQGFGKILCLGIHVSHGHDGTSFFLHGFGEGFGQLKSIFAVGSDDGKVLQIQAVDGVGGDATAQGIGGDIELEHAIAQRGDTVGGGGRGDQGNPALARAEFNGRARGHITHGWAYHGVDAFLAEQFPELPDAGHDIALVVEEAYLGRNGPAFFGQFESQGGAFPQRTSDFGELAREGRHQEHVARSARGLADLIQFRFHPPNSPVVRVTRAIIRKCSLGG